MSSSRLFFSLQVGFIFCILAASIYLEKFKGLIPCPLCLLQRGVFILMLLTAIIGIILKTKPRLISTLLFVLALIGIILAGRQVWLQHFPVMNGECGASIQYMLEVLPLKDVLAHIFAGSTECSEVNMRFASFTLAEWSLIAFLSFFLDNFWFIVRGYRHSTS